jgi:hypothetical protein
MLEAFRLSAVSNSTIYRFGISSLLFSLSSRKRDRSAYLVPDCTPGPSGVAALTNTEHSSNKKLAKKVDRIVRKVCIVVGTIDYKGKERDI